MGTHRRRIPAKMVPSDLKPSLAPSLRAWPQALRSKGRLEVTLRLLSAPSFDSSGSSLARASARLSRPKPASRSGFSLAHDDRPFPSGHYEVTVPDLPLQHLAGPSSGPLARDSLLVPVCPGIGDLNAACPFALISVPRSRSRLGSPLPLRGLPPPDHCVPPPICDRKARLPKQPDFRCSPPGRYAAGGSSLRTRYCFGGWLFLKPLGTDSILSLGD
jgi:hypothetical protein